MLRNLKRAVPLLLLLVTGCDLSNLPGVLTNPGSTPSKAPSTAPTTGSVLYSRDIQPHTQASSCKACHQAGGNGPQLSLGSYVVDAKVNGTTLRSMLNQYGNLQSGQLAMIDAWIAAGRPETEIPGSPAASSGSPSQAATSPHAAGWRSQHGHVVKSAGGVQYAQIQTGKTCASCHTIAATASGLIPQSPAATHTCFSCHNGPAGEGEDD